MVRQLTRMLSALEAKVEDNYLLALAADHGMPSEPSSPDHRHFAPATLDLLHEKSDPDGKQLITSFEPENRQIFVDEDRLSYLGLTFRDLAHFLKFFDFSADEIGWGSGVAMVCGIRFTGFCGCGRAEHDTPGVHGRE